MNREQLRDVLKLHELWLENPDKGARAVLEDVSLGCADLQSVNLRSADLIYVNLCHSDLRGINLSHTKLKCVNLSHADLKGADLSHADLKGVNLIHANLEDADLSYANLEGADLSHANLEGADLIQTNLKDVDLDYSCLPLFCGSLKAQMDDRQAIQLLYHTLSIVKNSNNVSEELKEKLLTDCNLEIANKFHRVKECGELKKKER